MKRIIFLFVFGIMSLASFGHVDTLYLSKDRIAFSYHSNLKCTKIHEIIDTLVVSELTEINKLTKYYRCHDCISNDMIINFKETITNNKNKISRENILSVQNNTQNNEIYKAGIYQQKSAKCNFIALGFAGAAGLTAVIPSMMSEEDGGTKGFYAAAGIFGVGALVSEICACSFKLKSGKSLKVAANHIQYNF